jgi:hypothetical protein
VGLVIHSTIRLCGVVLTSYPCILKFLSDTKIRVKEELFVIFGLFPNLVLSFLPCLSIFIFFFSFDTLGLLLLSFVSSLLFFLSVSFHSFIFSFLA